MTDRTKLIKLYQKFKNSLDKEGNNTYNED